MTRRYYSAVPIAALEVALTGEEAHHLLHVLRAAPGMRVTLFDGAGCEFEAEVTACGRASVELKVVDRREVNRELPFALTLGVALPKGDRQRWLVEKAVELGVTKLVPLRTERSQAVGDKPGEKLARYVIEASKQCGRNRLMEIAELVAWDEWLARAPSDTGRARRLVAHVVGQPLRSVDLKTPCPTFVAVGPEGGFSEAEIAAAESASWQSVALGPRILRVETAALVLASALALES